MQDIHSIGDGRLFGGGGNRRLRPHNHQQALKCPRCDSLNTKFCYYNNYNLSQPRHFCKGCRRYWTIGGVLRNVPVGGGCRKTKRSSKPKQPPSSASDAAATAAATSASPPRKSNSHSSSDSSSLTATTTTATAGTATATAEVVSGGSSSNSAPALFNFPPDSRFFVPQTTNFDPPFIDHQSSDGGSIFPDMGTFTSLMTSSNDPSPLGFSIAHISSYGLENQNQGQLVENQRPNHQMQEMTDAGYLNQTGQIEFSAFQNRTSNGELAGVDWQAAGGDQDQDQGIFDLTGTVGQAYWSQTQWPDHKDHSLHYLP